ncbi:uncharacterized protein LTHEOB_5762 [Neofusicoccum parvum]|uniref:Uncharacterized protein LTHEOB_5762 n=1 Tax=Neofusicoccum parvum TaxID=310453 RepID=A0ACB5SLA0_9PEZI|nr:uncharacterized protein LTHEOB_5762 [Neofusicoccum parvum]
MAKLMNDIPETAVFRRFGVLNSLNLLYLQAELMEIEQNMKDAQISDHYNPQGNKSLYAKNWFFLSVSKHDGDENQLSLAELAREKLEKYNTALVHQEKILSMKKPGTYDMDFIQRFIASNDSGAPYALTGIDSEVWGSCECPKDRANDLVALRPRHEEDWFSKWVTGKGISKFFDLGCARNRKPSPDHGFVGYEDTSLLRITYNITSVLASLLPIASIVILYCVQPMKIRLAIIAGFNIVLSLCLIAFTTARRADVFAVAAAFSAVQVVFVSGNET